MSVWITIAATAGRVTFENGDEFAVGTSRPVGLGSIQLRRTAKAGLHVVRLSNAGHFSYALKLHRDGLYRLGASRGHRVVEPTEEADPIKRVLREMSIPVSVLVHATEANLEIGERWYDNGHCPNGRNTNRWFTDGEVKEVSAETMEQPHGCFNGGGYVTSVVSGARYAIRVDSGRHANGWGWSRPGQIVVWPGCDPTALADALAPVMYGEGADHAYPQALQDFSAAQKWVAENFVIEADDEANSLIVRRTKEDEWGYERERFDLVAIVGFRSPDTLDGLVRKHGLELVEGYFGELQRSFMSAIGDGPEVAAQYVLAHYRVVAYAEGDKRKLKLARHDRPEGLVANLDCVDSALVAIRRQYPGIEDLLFEKATERVDLVPSHPCYLFEGGNRRLVAWRSYSDHTVVATEDDAIRVVWGEGEFARQVLCLSDEERRQGDVKNAFSQSRRICGALTDGDIAYGDSRSVSALLPVSPGETKNFVFRVSDDYGYGPSIWGVTVHRAGDGTVSYQPYDNGATYVCAGQWCSEVRRVER